MESNLTGSSSRKRPTANGSKRSQKRRLYIARSGGKVASDARKAIEQQTGVPVITSKNAAQLNQVVTSLIEATDEIASKDKPKK